jgi:hypothetical protein
MCVERNCLNCDFCDVYDKHDKKIVEQTSLFVAFCNVF